VSPGAVGLTQAASLFCDGAPASPVDAAVLAPAGQRLRGRGQLLVHARFPRRGLYSVPRRGSGLGGSSDGSGLPIGVLGACLRRGDLLGRRRTLCSLSGSRVLGGQEVLSDPLGDLA
jgi:hypothetical protein